MKRLANDDVFVLGPEGLKNLDSYIAGVSFEALKIKNSLSNARVIKTEKEDDRR